VDSQTLLKTAENSDTIGTFLTRNPANFSAMLTQWMVWVMKHPPSQTCLVFGSLTP